MVDLPDRRKWIHITLPWLHTNHALVLRQNQTPPDRGFAGRLAIFKLPVHNRIARERISRSSEIVQFPDDSRRHQGGRKTGSAGAAFMELRAALAALAEKPPECSSMALRVAPVPEATVQLGLASTFEAAGAADKLRGEIGNLFRDGTLGATMAKYSYYGLESELGHLRSDGGRRAYPLGRMDRGIVGSCLLHRLAVRLAAPAKRSEADCASAKNAFVRSSTRPPSGMRRSRSTAK